MDAAAQPVTLYAEFTAIPGAEARVAELLLGLTTNVRTEPGNLLFEPAQRRDDPAKFFVYEIYRDQAAFQAHVAAPYGKSFNDALVSLIVEDGSQLTFLRHLGEPATAARPPQS
mgnify:FL=1